MHNQSPPTGPITLIINAASGSKEGQTLQDQLRDILGQTGRPVKIEEIQPHDDFFRRFEPVVKQAISENGLIVGAGGDGTINSVATLCYRHKCPFGVIPMGTFNYFARELHIPVDPLEAARIIHTGHIKTVSAGLIQERLFLINASFGLYTKIIMEREEATSRFGRRRFVAAISAVASLFRNHKPFSINIKTGEVTDSHFTSMVFIGNNTLQLANLGLDVATCTQQNKLAVVIMKQFNRMATARLLWRGLLKNLNDESLETFCTNEFEVHSRRKRINLVIDGEIVSVTTPLEFKVDPQALQVIAPQEPAA